MPTPEDELVATVGALVKDINVQVLVQTLDIAERILDNIGAVLVNLANKDEATVREHIRYLWAIWDQYTANITEAVKSIQTGADEIIGVAKEELHGDD